MHVTAMGPFTKDVTQFFFEILNPPPPHRHVSVPIFTAHHFQILINFHLYRKPIKGFILGFNTGFDLGFLIKVFEFRFNLGIFKFRF